jgi:8-oxo-dGTP pyrophosphatase MutT (NUDIX family)
MAHWYYEVGMLVAERAGGPAAVGAARADPPPTPRHQDECRDEDPSLASLPLKAFAQHLARRLPDVFARAGAGDVGAALARFAAFKARVPTAGTMLLDPTLTKVLLVRGLKAGASWGFPRGKLAAGESDAACAARETVEETGLDVGGAIVEGDAIEIYVDGQRSKLYVVPGVDEATPFAPTVRGEIGALAWHLIADLPSTKDAGALVYTSEAGVRHRFFRVWPYVKKLRAWVKARQTGERGGGRARAAAAAPGSTPAPAPATTTPATAKKRTKPRRVKDGAARRPAAPAAVAAHVRATAEVAAGAGAAAEPWWRGFDAAAIEACLV